MNISLRSDRGMGERGISSPIAAPIECPSKPFFRCKQFLVFALSYKAILKASMFLLFVPSIVFADSSDIDVSAANDAILTIRFALSDLILVLIGALLVIVGVAFAIWFIFQGLKYWRGVAFRAMFPKASGNSGLPKGERFYLAHSH